ncbi:MAG: hypothetical protein VCC99_03260, partial [Alphaproteobacteria bacterium]
SYRLLSELEYVARADTRTKYSFDDSINVRDANYVNKNGKTKAVDSKLIFPPGHPASAWLPSHSL